MELFIYTKYLLTLHLHIVGLVYEASKRQTVRDLAEGTYLAQYDYYDICIVDFVFMLKGSAYFCWMTKKNKQ